MIIFALYYEEKFTSSSTSSLSVSKYYSITIEGRDNVINDIVFAANTISFKFKNSTNNGNNDKKNIITTDIYMIYDIIADLRSEGWNLLSAISSNNGSKEKYIFEFDDNKDDDDSLPETSTKSPNKSVFHSFKTIFSKKSSNKSNSNSKSDDKKHNSTNDKKHNSDDNGISGSSLLSISLDNQDSNQQNSFVDDTTNDKSNVLISTNSATDTNKKTTYEPEKSPVMSPKKKIQQQLYAQHINNNKAYITSPKTIANPNRVNTATKPNPKSKPGSNSPQRLKTDYSPTRTTPTRTTNNKTIRTDVNDMSTSKQIILNHSLFKARKNEHKEPPLELNELPKKKKYDLSLNLSDIDDENIFKNGHDDSRSKTSLDILWS